MCVITWESPTREWIYKYQSSHVKVLKEQDATQLFQSGQHYLPLCSQITEGLNFNVTSLSKATYSVGDTNSHISVQLPENVRGLKVGTEEFSYRNGLF